MSSGSTTTNRQVMAHCLGIASAFFTSGAYADDLSERSEPAFPTLVQELNDRYANTTMQCPGGKAAYHCSGIMEHVRITSLDLTDDEKARNTVAFSFLRKDIATDQVWNSGASGIIVNHFLSDTPGNDNTYPLVARCIFPYDGVTHGRPDGCGTMQPEPVENPPGSSSPCKEQGISTAAAWAGLFNHQLSWKNANCSFDVDTRHFQVAMEAHELMEGSDQGGTPYRKMWNEVVMAAWPQEASVSLPIEAMFYMPKRFSSAVLVQALQCDYFKKTGRVIPIVRMNLDPDQGEPVFSADLHDQAVLPGDVVMPLACPAENDVARNAARANLGNPLMR